MTKKEAVELQEQVEKELSEIVGDDCIISLALTNKLKICFKEHIDMICLNLDASGVDWISWCGWYDDLKHIIENALGYMRENKNIIDKLIWSYEHITELED